MLQAEGHIISWCKSILFLKPTELQQFTAAEDLSLHLSLALIKPLNQTLNTLPNLKLPLTVARAMPTGGSAVILGWLTYSLPFLL